LRARFNPSLHGPFGTTMDEETIPTFEYIIKKLNDYNLAYIHLSEPLMFQQYHTLLLR
jgi:N-ethylmaleimide reductase